MIEFFEPFELPSVTHNSLNAVMRGNRPAIIKSAKLRDAERAWEARLAKHKPKTPLTGALAITVVFCYLNDKQAGQPKATKPDLDNLEKVLFDCLERLEFFDIGDQQIAHKKVSKAFDKVQGAYVKIEEIAR